MLFDIQGRRQSSRTVADDVTALRLEIEALSPDERQALEVILGELREGPSATLQAIETVQYREPLVPVDRFLTDPYYMGETGKSLYPKVRQSLCDLFEGDYTEAICGGALGWGKSTFGQFALLWQVYEMGMQLDVHQTIGLMPGSAIILGVLSVLKQQAQRGIFEEILQKLDRSPWFKAQMPWDPQNDRIVFPHNIQIWAGAPANTSTIGANLVSVVMDEANFIGASRKGQEGGVAQKVYQTIVRRRKSRYLKLGRMPGMVILLSSKTQVGAFTEQRIAEATKDPTIFVREFATWDVQPGFEDKAWFWVLTGDELERPRILTDAEVPAVRERIEQPGRAARVIQIPEVYRPDFTDDLDGALREIAGIATTGIRPFLQQRARITEALDVHRVHPFTVEIWESGDPAGQIRWELLCTRQKRRLRGGFAEDVWAPQVLPHVPRHVHLDLSRGKRDAAGLAIGTIARWRDVVRHRHGETYTELAPEIWFDFYLRIVAPTGGEILFSDLRELVYGFQQHGFSFTRATMDAWMSGDTQQQFEQRGIKCETLSLDKTPRAYQALKAALYEKRVQGYLYAPLQRELRDLEEDPMSGKVDHPVRGMDGERGSKDVADCLAGVVCSLADEHVKGAPLGGHAILTDSRGPDEDDSDESWVLGRGGRRARVVAGQDARARDEILPVPILFDRDNGDDD